MVLADFVRLPARARVLDLGSGCGTLGVLLCATHPHCRVTGLEIDPTAHAAALENIRRNGLEGRLEARLQDLRAGTEGGYDACVSNPPYFSGGPGGAARTARREDLCTLAQLLDAAAGALKFGGDLFLVHRPERLGEIFALGSARGLEPKRLCPVHHRSGGPVALVLVQLRKGAKPGLQWQELCLHTADGSPTDDHKRIYHM